MKRPSHSLPVRARSRWWPARGSGLPRLPTCPGATARRARGFSASRSQRLPALNPEPEAGIEIQFLAGLVDRNCAVVFGDVIDAGTATSDGEQRGMGRRIDM